MQYTYYIGLQLPKEISERIQAVEQELFDETLISPPLEPHITLLPPPAVERIEPEELARQSKVTAEGFWPLKLQLAGVETYKDYAIVITVKSEQIYNLQQRLVQLLPPEAEAIYYPNPKFSPHVTLSHTLHDKSFPPELVGKFREKLASLLPVTFDGTHLTLFKWIAPQEYQAIAI